MRRTNCASQKIHRVYYIASEHTSFLLTVDEIYCRKLMRLNNYYVFKPELVYLTYDDIVDCRKGIRTQEILKQYLCGRSILKQNIEITKFFFYKNCFIKPSLATARAA